MEQTRHGTAFATLAVAALAACLFAAAAAAQKDDAGSALLERRAAMLELMHHQAEIALVTAAQDRNFEAFFRASDAAEREMLRQRLDRLTESMRTAFFVDSVCLMDRSGQEIASTDDPSEADETESTEADFFREAFLHPARHVYLSSVFVSDASRRWVVSYATPIVIDEKVRAILHYEHSLASFQRVATDALGEVAGYLLLIDREGWVIADSRHPVETGQNGVSADPADYFEHFEWNGAGLADLQVRLGRDGGFMEQTMAGPDGDYRIQYRTVRGWTLVLFEKA